MTIKTVIRLQDDVILVFDESGEQIPQYQGPYQDVKTNILRDAPPDAVFQHWFQNMAEAIVVPREHW